MRGNAWLLTLGVWLGVAACNTPQETVDEVACTTLCRCLTTLPGQQDECVTDCIGGFAPVSDPCAECINLHATECSTLQADCSPICIPATPREGDH